MQPNRDILTRLVIGAAAASIVLTGLAFWLSFAHLEQIAHDNGLPDYRSWAWPATVDLFIIIGELLMLRAALQHRVDPWAIGLTAFGSATSIGFNIAGVGVHAPVMQYAVAAVPPTAALIAFGAIMRQLHEHLATRNTKPATPTPTPVPQRVAAPATPRPAAPATPPAVAPAAPRPTPVAAAAAAPATRSVQRPATATATPDVQHLEAQVEEALRPVATDLDGVQLLTVADVAALKGVAPATVRSWVSRNKLAPVQRDGDGRSLFHPNDVADLD